ncbi:hypothetical protein [Desmospora profundinema]|uniref:Uncharacterized protein n=1 Tax=Desmospora profundinema TaxID=1571184 RepID=A0ABU1IP88_9BACL|nr:hypothetical protein [Desmospora profundinema]MDR6226602.1 hypothetical protein [Desmospora profundinema]
MHDWWIWISIAMLIVLCLPVLAMATAVSQLSSRDGTICSMALGTVVGTHVGVVSSVLAHLPFLEAAGWGIAAGMAAGVWMGWSSGVRGVMEGVIAGWMGGGMGAMMGVMVAPEHRVLLFQVGTVFVFGILFFLFLLLEMRQSTISGKGNRIFTWTLLAYAGMVLVFGVLLSGVPDALVAPAST